MVQVNLVKKNIFVFITQLQSKDKGVNPSYMEAEVLSTERKFKVEL